MARIGKADRAHSGHYLTAVALVTVVVASLAWYGQNRTLALAATALGLYALHLLSIRFLLDNQKRQQQVMDAQWEVLQRFINATESEAGDTEDLVPAMPIDREAPEQLDRPDASAEASDSRTEAPEIEARPPAEPVVLGDVVPPAESLGDSDMGFALVADEDSIEPLSAMADFEDPQPVQPMADETPPVESVSVPGHGTRPPGAEVPVPRHFALGTVALVRDLLTPAEVARVLLEQRRQPGKKFGALAVEMGLLTDTQREELLLAQQEGLFTDAEMRDARERLRQFRESAAHSIVGTD